MAKRLPRPNEMYFKMDQSICVFDFITRVKTRISVSTNSVALDKLLSRNGGLMCGELTEICGPPGSGKTQIGFVLRMGNVDGDVFPSMQSALMCQQNGGTAVYLGTDLQLK